MQKHRIYTNIGIDQKVTVELKQEYDLLEILSLKFSQQEVYSSFCGDYGVVCGRITVNNGFGVPNARVSIFIPISETDENDPVISGLYPYKLVTERNDDGYRYNLLPSRKQHGGHEPTGTFPDQKDILGREEILEVYEKYYKYTVKTNIAGDFMIWGVPLGQQELYVDVDLSDIGCFSLRPYDFIRTGSGVDEFKSEYEFKSSTDIDSLPQIVTFSKTIEVYPFWGNQDLCEIGITRSDFDLSTVGVKIEPKAFIIGGTFTDTEKNAVNKNCTPRRKMGRKCDMTTSEGTIEALRFTTNNNSLNRPIIEQVSVNEDIDESGSFLLPIDMNMDYVITNEFGENEYSNDPNKGIATAGVYRFRFTIKNESLGRVRTTASYLVPNIREYTNDIQKSYAWSTDYDDYPSDAISGMLKNDYGSYYPEDYFYRFTYNKVYTVSSFQSSYFAGENMVGKPLFLGIKELDPPEEEDCSDGVNQFPMNFGIKNYTFTLLISDVLLLVEHILNATKLVFFNSIVRVLYRISCAIDGRPLRGLAKKLRTATMRIAESGQKKLYLINYPECEECNGEDNEFTVNGLPLNSSPDPLNGCRVGFTGLNNVYDNNNIRYIYLTGTTLSNPDYPMMGDPLPLNNPTQTTINPFTFDKDPTQTGCTSSILDITEQWLQHPLYNSGFTETAFFIQNQTGNTPTTTISGYTVTWNDDSIDMNVTGPIFTGTPVYSKTYTYDFNPYNNTTYSSSTFTIDWSGSTFPISFPRLPQPLPGDSSPLTDSEILSGIITSLSGLSPYGPSGATFTVTGGTISLTPNISHHNQQPTYRQFGDITVTQPNPFPPPTGFTTTITPTITDGPIIDYVDVFITDEDNQFVSPGQTQLSIRNPNFYDPPPLPPPIRPLEDSCDLYDVPYDECNSWQYVYTDNTTSPGLCVNPDTNKDVNKTILSYMGTMYDCGSTKSDKLQYYLENGERVYPIKDNFNGESFDKLTSSGVSEFEDGVFTIVPGSQTNSRLRSYLKEFRRRKRVGKLFCGGIVNYSFIDNWLSGSLYFFAFKAKNKRRNTAKYCTDLVRWVSGQSRFYYRSCAYNPSTITWGTAWNDTNKRINHPTTFVDLGPRDEFIKEICTDPSLDVNCSVSRQISPTTFKPHGEILGLIINYRMDVSAGDFALNNFFDNGGFSDSGFRRVLDGDIMQLISINNEVGIEGFDLQNPKYIGYSYQSLDPETYPDIFKKGTDVWGPTPITLDFSEDGVRQRLCLNQPTHLDYSGNLVQGRLTESSQRIPFYLWDKKGRGFGTYVDGLVDDQSWDYTDIQVQPLQGMTFGYSFNFTPNDSSDQYLLPPITYTNTGLTISNLNVTDEIPFDVVSDIDDHTNYNTQYPGFQYLYVTSGTTEIPLGGTLYTRYGSAPNWETTPWDFTKDFIIKRTEDYYDNNRQILSTPFMFYFGLRPNNTGLDKLIQKFGPSGAFQTVN